MARVSGKTHTKEQLDNWANQHNPNNKAYKGNASNRANQKNPNNQKTHNTNRRYKGFVTPLWAPDYPEYDD